ncbi:TetR/AcrR family transcriptional regulator [Lysinibacter cavernae]|uniref:AcrR family transcriptional regulator n=1 Tax=Lysinibacter cavernae TaxID=1640652 RepID=A0A7X5R0F8_9MICO|nr:TetR/AcrR family transcriptional regulator [Lysinibacter cavernae]NIH53293.1 AcrR family transcriptional regulator [Lysinibacter cavernae]
MAEHALEQQVADPRRRRDAERTQADILRVATQEFADVGFAGARVDEIAKKTQTAKRMIYYYFGSKEGLYLRVMEIAYETVRNGERDLDMSDLPPADGLRKLAEFTYDHHTSHRDFIRLVSIENIHRAEHIANSETIPDLNQVAVETLSDLLTRGQRAGIFRSDLDALDVHMMISAYSFFHVANRYTFRTIFGRDLLEQGRHEHYRTLIGDMVVAAVTDLAADSPVN